MDNSIAGRVYPIRVNLPDGKHWCIEYVDGKMVADYNCEIDEAVEKFTKTLVMALDEAFEKATI